MPEVRHVSLSDRNWSEIAEAVQLSGEGLRVKPFHPLSDGFFTAAVAFVPGEWQRLAVVVFPYADPAWQQLATHVLEFEARSWQRWCELQEALAGEAGGGCPPLWWSRGEPRNPSVQNVTVTADDGTVTMPSLVRPYIPYPTLRERPLAPTRQAQALADLRMVAEWIVGDEAVAPFLQRRAHPDAHAKTSRRSSWNRLLWRRRPPHIPFVFPELANDDRRLDILRPHQLLCDGRRLIPTRWRAFHGDHATFGSTPARSSLRDFVLER